MINNDNKGGNMIYLTSDGSVQIPNKAGLVLVQGPTNIHGATPIDDIKYVLMLVSHEDMNQTMAVHV
jgi:hypothetical protein